MSSKRGIILFILLAVKVLESNTSGIKINKIICNVTDPEMFQLDLCLVKAESRNLQYITVNGTVLQTPVEDFKIRVQIMKRLNGWRPFLYDLTFNCDTVNHQNKLTRFIWPHITNLSNIRSLRCPLTVMELEQSYYETKRIENTYIEKVLEILPIPSGDYGAFVTVYLNNKLTGTVNTYATFS